MTDRPYSSCSVETELTRRHFRKLPARHRMLKKEPLCSDGRRNEPIASLLSIDCYCLVWFPLAPQLARRLRLSSFGCHCLEPEIYSAAFLSTHNSPPSFRLTTSYLRPLQPTFRFAQAGLWKFCNTVSLTYLWSIGNISHLLRMCISISKIWVSQSLHLWVSQRFFRQEWDAPDLQAAANMTSTAVGSLVREVNALRFSGIFRSLWIWKDVDCMIFG